MSRPVEPAASRVPPVPAIVAAPLAVLSAFAPGLFFLVALGFSGGTLFGGWADGSLGLGLSVGLFPAATAVLASLPGVRAWVAARRTGHGPAT